MKHSPRLPQPAVGPLLSGALFELSLYSTFIFILVALLAQFLLTLQTAVLLNFFDYPIQYRLFGVRYLSDSNLGWTDAKIIFAFGSGPFVLSALGFWMLRVLKKIRREGWKTKLVFSWLAFVLVNALPCGIIAGAFFFDSFGILFSWFNNNLLVRGMIALVVFFVLIVFNQSWLFLFLRTSYSAVLVDNSDHRKIYVRNVLYKPLLFGGLILLFFNWPFNSFYWPMFLLSLGTVAIPTSRRLQGTSKVYFSKSDKKIFSGFFQILFFVLVIAILWTVNYLLINADRFF